MVRSIGLDIVEVSRIERDIEMHEDRFVQRLLGDDEIRLYEVRKDKPQFLAGRFAAKEAVIKALGTFLTNRPKYNSLQIVNDDKGQPELDVPEEIIDRLEGCRCMLSISHERKYAVAVAIFVEV